MVPAVVRVRVQVRFKCLRSGCALVLAALLCKRIRREVGASQCNLDSLDQTLVSKLDLSTMFSIYIASSQERDCAAEAL